VTQPQAKRPKTPFEWGVLIVAAIGGLAAVLWRLIWPWTGARTDFIFIVVCLVGLTAMGLLYTSGK
jgi:hypothetical protein